MRGVEGIPKAVRFQGSVISEIRQSARPPFGRQPFTVGAHVGLVFHEIGPVYLMGLAILGAAVQGFMLALQVSQSCFEPFAFRFQIVRHVYARHMLSATVIPQRDDFFDVPYGLADASRKVDVLPTVFRL